MQNKSVNGTEESGKTTPCNQSELIERLGVNDCTLFKTFRITCLLCGSDDVDIDVRSQLDNEIRLRCIRCGNAEDNEQEEP